MNPRPRRAFTATFSLALLCLTLAVPGAVPLAYAQGAAEKSGLKPSTIHYWTANNELSRALVTQNIGTLAQAALTAPAPTTPKAWLYRLALLLRADYPKETLQFLTTRPPFLDAKTGWGLGYMVSQTRNYKNFAVAKRLLELFPEAPGATEWFYEWAKIVPYGEADAWLARQGSQGSSAWLDLRIRWRHDRAPGTEQVLLKPLKQAVHQNPDDISLLLRYVNAVPMSEGSEKTKWLAATLRPRLAVQCFLLADMGAIPGYVKVALYERALRLPFTKRDVTYYTEYQNKYPRGYDGLAYSRNELDMDITEQKFRTWTKINLLNLYRQYNEPQKMQRLREQLEKDNGAGKRYVESIRPELDAEATAENFRQSPQSPDHWIERSRYYREVGMKKSAVAAFQKALVLTPLTAADTETVTKRGEVIQAYADYLLQEGLEESQRHPNAQVIAWYERVIALAPYDPTREGYNVRDLVIGAYTEHFERQSPAAGYAYVRKQLEALSDTSVSPAPGVRSENLIQALLNLSDENYYRSHLGHSSHPSHPSSAKKQLGRIAFDDPLLWGYLASLPKWDGVGNHDIGRRLLACLLKVAPEEKREGQRLRAEAMLQGDAFDQRMILGEAISEGLGWKHAVPYYRSLLERASAKEKPEYSFISYVLHQLRNGSITAGDYRGLLQADEELQHLETNPRIISPWGAQTQIQEIRQIQDHFVYAMVAAKAGEKTEALRHVTQWVNQDRRVATFSIGDAYTTHSGGYAYTATGRQIIWDELRTVFESIEKAEPQCAAPARLWKALRESPSKGEIPTIQ